jgi:hypothetical protein
MVRGRLRSFVNIALVSQFRTKLGVRSLAGPESFAAGEEASGVELSMFVRVGVVAASIMGAGLFGASLAKAQELNPEQARAFVVGKLFSYTCFEGTAGQGRIFPDGSVVGTIRIRGRGESRFAALPPGTIRVDANSVCAHLNGLPFTPCFRVQKLDHRSFRGSLSGMGFAYCDFYQRNPRSQLISSAAEQPAATPIPNVRPSLRPSLAQ